MLAIKARKDWVYYALFQYFWIVAILPKALQLAALGGLLCLIWFRSGREKPLDSFTVLQLAYLVIYGVSIVVNALWDTHEFERIAAAVNTWAITAVALGFYHFYRHTDLDRQRLGKYSLCNLLILCVLWLLFEVAGERLGFSLFGRTLSGADWVNGAYEPRFMGFLDYANLVVFCVLFFYPAALEYLGKKHIVSAALTAALGLVIYATNSRSGLVLYLVMVLGYGLFGLQGAFHRYFRQNRTAVYALAVTAVVLVAAVLMGQLIGLVNEFLNMREGSNSMRMTIYQESLKRTFTESPLVGIGIKDQLAQTGYPYGSHSTYIGVVYKAGILGGGAYLASMVYMAWKCLFGKPAGRMDMLLKVCVLAILLLMAFEDVDGANWCVCIFYVLLGMMRNPKSEQTSTGR